MKFKLDYNESQIVLTLAQENSGFLNRFFSNSTKISLEKVSNQERDLMFALADLKSIAETIPNSLKISDGRIEMSHPLVSALGAHTASTLGLPPLVDLVFATDVEGAPGQTNFRIRHDWLRDGQKQPVRRVGSILKTSEGDRRIPAWLLRALLVSESHQTGKDLSTDWEALAEFRRALQDDPEGSADGEATPVELSNFLRNLQVQIADAFSIDPKGSDIDPEFEVVPFSRKSLDDEAVDPSTGEVSSALAELADRPLKEFQKRVREKGALPSYKVGNNRYLVIDQAARPALAVMARMHHANRDERLAFIQNPRRLITEAIESDLRNRGVLDGMTAGQEAETVETLAFPTFVETKEYSARVIGKTIFTGSTSNFQEGSGTTWLPEIFGEPVAQIIQGLPIPKLEELEERIQQALSKGEQTIEVEGDQIAATPSTAQAIRRQIEIVESSNATDTQRDDTQLITTHPAGHPIILDVKNNYEKVQWEAKIAPRPTSAPNVLPQNVVTPLKEHQIASFDWQVQAWKAGLPGILNADEQGLGKTLQTIAFLSWLKAAMASDGSVMNGPILVVAPTSLLENWEQEVERHLAPGGLGHLVRLYGSGISAFQSPGRAGNDTKDGDAHLDLSFIHEAVQSNKGHKYWLLTTYTTLTNYQHSLGAIKFSALVFDEIQALKNPDSLRARAALAMNADFRIGLTGTPIENSMVDLWAIFEQLFSGRLSTLQEFRSKYGTPDERNLLELYRSIFEGHEDTPALALRRLKSEVAKDLPQKVRLLHPRAMSSTQSQTYELARNKLASGSRGAALKMLHHIRSVSVHPSVTTIEEPEDFIKLSGRLQACFDILDQIHANGERVLVFIEHVQMQYRFIEILKSRYRLSNVDLINGSTAIHHRQQIVNRFQRHLTQDEGFDVLVLGPKAAGTGLTLTAATHVIHLSRWWNPAVEEQCNDRVHRIGQTREVTIHIPMAIHEEFREHSFDCLLHSLMTTKRRLANSALWPMGDTNDDAAQLQRMLAENSVSESTEDPVQFAILKTFERDNVPLPEIISPNSYRYT